MSETQDLLSLKMAAPAVTAEEVDAFCTWLEGKDWVKASQIESALGLDDRAVRALAEHSEGRILSGPGCPGYKLFTGKAEVGEADRCASRLESQGKKMLARAASIRRRFHRYARA